MPAQRRGIRCGYPVPTRLARIPGNYNPWAVRGRATGRRVRPHNPSPQCPAHGRRAADGRPDPFGVCRSPWLHATEPWRLFHLAGIAVSILSAWTALMGCWMAYDEPSSPKRIGAARQLVLVALAIKVLWSIVNPAIAARSSSAALAPLNNAILLIGLSTLIVEGVSGWISWGLGSRRLQETAPIPAVSRSPAPEHAGWRVCRGDRRGGGRRRFQNRDEDATHDLITSASARQRLADMVRRVRSQHGQRGTRPPHRIRRSHRIPNLRPE